MKPIETLLERYFQGETTLEEEQTLREYFRQAEVPSALEMYRSLFTSLDEWSNIKTPADFEQKLQKAIQNRAQTRPVLRWWRYAAAAAALLAGAIWWTLSVEPEKQVPVVAQEINWNQYEVKDSAEAYRLTMEALALLSDKFKKGTSDAAQEMKRLDQLNILHKSSKKGSL